MRATAKLLKPHHPAEVEIHEVLTELARHANVLPVPLLLNAPAASDLGEQFLSGLLSSRADLILITQDKLLQAGLLKPRIMTPQDFVVQWMD